MSDPGTWGPGVVVLRVERAGGPTRWPTRPSSREPSSPAPWRPASRPPARPEPWRRPSRGPSSPEPWRRLRRSLGGRLLGRRRGRSLCPGRPSLRRRRRDRGRRGGGLHGLDIGAPGLGERGARLACGGLGALGLDGLAGCDAGLGGLRRGGRADGLGGLGAGLDGSPAERGIHVPGQARLAPGGRVRVDRAGLGCAVEGRERLGKRGVRIALDLAGGDLDGLGDEGLGLGGAGAVDGGTPLSLANPLLPGWRPRAGPAAGGVSHGSVGPLGRSEGWMVW